MNWLMGAVKGFGIGVGLAAVLCYLVEIGMHNLRNPFYGGGFYLALVLIPFSAVVGLALGAIYLRS